MVRSPRPPRERLRRNHSPLRQVGNRGVQIQSPRLFSKEHPSTRTSKGFFLIVAKLASLGNHCNQTPVRSWRRTGISETVDRRAASWTKSNNSNTCSPIAAPATCASASFPERDEPPPSGPQCGQQTPPPRPPPHTKPRSGSPPSIPKSRKKTLRLWPVLRDRRLDAYAAITNRFGK
jgi:hypothetical protein